MSTPRRGYAQWIVAAALISFAAVALAAVSVADEDRDKDDMPLREALEDVVDEGWIYDKLDRAYALAKKSGKPLLVAFR